nr:MAG TPA_asm: hypothetical protein [Caudoviricetes sp.]
MRQGPTGRQAGSSPATGTKPPAVAGLVGMLFENSIVKH